MSTPVKFTDAAVEHIAGMLQKHQGGVGFRLSVKKTGCSGFAYLPTIVEEVKAGDIHFVANDNLPVFIDPKALEFFDELVVDYVAEEGHVLKQRRLVFINPKETGRCGCGESFTVG
jgi:iron-sulfur cluster assembly protein